MSKKNNVGEVLFAVVCVGGIVAVLVANEGATWLLWAQSMLSSVQAAHGAHGVSNAVGGAVDGSALPMLLQAAVGFAVVAMVGGGAMWLRNRSTVDVDADGAPQIDYGSPDWVNVRVIR